MLDNSTGFNVGGVPVAIVSRGIESRVTHRDEVAPIGCSLHSLSAPVTEFYRVRTGAHEVVVNHRMPLFPSQVSSNAR